MTQKQLQRAAIDAARRARLGLAQRDEAAAYCSGRTRLGEPCRWHARASGFCHWHEQQQLVAV